MDSMLLYFLPFDAMLLHFLLLDAMSLHFLPLDAMLLHFLPLDAMLVVCMILMCLPKSVMLKDRDYDVTPYIIAHILRQIRNGSAKSARYLIKKNKKK